MNVIGTPGYMPAPGYWLGLRIDWHAPWWAVEGLWWSAIGRTQSEAIAHAEAILQEGTHCPPPTIKGTVIDTPCTDL